MTAPMQRQRSSVVVIALMRIVLVVMAVVYFVFVPWSILGWWPA